MDSPFLLRVRWPLYNSMYIVQTTNSSKNWWKEFQKLLKSRDTTVSLKNLLGRNMYVVTSDERTLGVAVPHIIIRKRQGGCQPQHSFIGRYNMLLTLLTWLLFFPHFLSIDGITIRMPLFKMSFIARTWSAKSEVWKTLYGCILGQFWTFFWKSKSYLKS